MKQTLEEAVNEMGTAPVAVVFLLHLAGKMPKF